ncbi:hypothetical protein [Burkholderia ubonensis]|uniref:hypothetical protein n=1 Tax=Burkholderia ubonensis TaxID=101571 RepID=UPI00076C2B7B|nr:hypothetical protein [Burkholderia ubonensis]KUZ70427.1 hypothetical protein WI37_28040 [Burkholderia ubonensis]
MPTCLVGRARICLEFIHRVLAVPTLFSLVLTAGEAVAHQHTHVVNGRSNTVPVIDESTNVVVTTIDSKCALFRKCLINSDCASYHCVSNTVGPPACQP